MRWPNLLLVLTAVERSAQEPKRAYLIHRPARDAFPPVGGILLSSFRQSTQTDAGIFFLVQRNSVPSLHMRCMITARRRAKATIAFGRPRRLATCMAYALSQDHFWTRVSMTCAALIEQRSYGLVAAQRDPADTVAFAELVENRR